MSFDLSQILFGLLCSALIGGLAYWRRSLTIGGWLGAILTGTATFGFGGWAWGVLLITFFVTSSLLSRYKATVKAARAGEKFEKGGQRDFGQAMANGGIAALLAVLYALLGQPTALYFVYIGVLATVTADTWATELGTLSTQSPRLVTTWKTVDVGTSGAITRAGTLAAAAGGLMIGCVAAIFALFEQPSTGFVWLIPLVGICSGLAGAFCDSFLGATVQAIYTDTNGLATERAVDQNGLPHRRLSGWSWLNNDAVNLISSIFGGGIAMLLVMLIT